MSRIGAISSSDGRKPGTPTIGTATAGDSQATVTFTAPDYLGKPSSSLTYTVVSSPSSIQNTGSGSPITVTGLSNGTSYSFTVKLNNTVLDSEFSSSSNNVTPVSASPNFAAPNFPNFPNFVAPPNFPNFVASPNFPNFIASPNFPNFIAQPNFTGGYYSLVPTSLSCANGCGGVAGASSASCASCGGCPSGYKCCFCPG